ncbi:MAG: hypothetical protein NT154_36720 [Verrucomicrobia bacterium]|nr:hypothetical protein [Verrucomicrobiota bacterium]
MPISFLRCHLRTLALSAALLGLVCAAQAAQPPAPKPVTPTVRTPATTNAAPAAPELPKSEFHIPTSPKDRAKDPFFPQSTRLFNTSGSGPSIRPVPVIELELKGISGVAARRFAIINSCTFTAGEEGDVPVSNGRAHIRVIEINADSAVVMFSGQRHVLRLRAGL